MPAHDKLQYQLNNEPLNIVLANGSTRIINKYVLEDTDKMVAKAIADVLCVGHYHLPYYRIIGHKHIITIGSVGKRKYGNPMGCYVLLTVNDNIQLEFIRFAYDIEKATQSHT